MTAAVMLLSSCGGTSIMRSDVTCDRFEADPDLSDSFRMSVGDKLEITVCSNPTTGYSWDYDIDDESVAGYVSDRYNEPATDKVGATGIETWVFEAKEPGRTLVLLVYLRPWEEGIPPVRTYTVQVDVE